MTQLTLLNSMAGTDFEAALRQHVEWGIEWLDLKDCIFGKSILDLTDEEAIQAGKLISAHGLRVWCLSSVLFLDDIEKGSAAFAANLQNGPARAARLAELFAPRKVRLLAPRSSLRASIPDAMQHLDDNHPWLVPLFAKAIETIAATGAEVTIENETHSCILASAAEVLGFFHRLRSATSANVSFTWDVQNFWQMGQFPSTAIYQSLRPLICYYHVKGGTSLEPGGPLAFASSLDDASWPVREITQRVLRDGCSPIICLNPPHGAQRTGYDYSNVTQRDIAFLRNLLAEIR